MFNNGITQFANKCVLTGLLAVSLQWIVARPAICKDNAVGIPIQPGQLQLPSALLNHHREHDAIDICNQVLQRQPSLAGAFAIRGKAEVDLGDTKVGMADLNQAIKMHFVQPWMYESLAHAHIFQRNFLSAAASYDQAAQLDPAQCLYNRQEGEVLTEVKEYQRALLCFAKAIKTEPKEADNYVSRASTYFALGQFQKAADDYSAAIKLKPWELRFYGLRSTCYKKLGRNDLFEKDIKKANENAFEL